MDREHVLRVLREHEQELRSAGVLHLRLFGSVARGMPTASSDIDLMADFDDSRHITLMTVGHTQGLLTALLGIKVDLCVAEWMREPVRKQFLKEAIVAF